MLVSATVVAVADEADDSRHLTDQGLLVLQNGQVIRGHMTRRTGGYDVMLPAGRLFIASESVRFHASDLEDAYFKLRDSFPERTPNEHIALARWCISNKLTSRARTELLDALHLDPYREDAQRMLRAVVREIEDAAAGVAARSSQTPSMQQLAESTYTPSRSLGGLSKTLARRFTVDIQPLISNKCASTGCHGSAAERSFVFRSTRNGSSPYIAEQNLAAVLNHLNLESPDDSPLLQATDGLHGGARVPLMRGRLGAAQRASLRNWIRQVTNEIAPGEVSQRSPISVSSRQRTIRAERQTAQRQQSPRSASMPAVGVSQTDAEITPGKPQFSASYAVHESEKSIEQTDRQFLNEARRANRQDAFDPEVFNERYHNTRQNRAAATTPQ